MLKQIEEAYNLKNNKKIAAVKRKIVTHNEESIKQTKKSKKTSCNEKSDSDSDTETELELIDSEDSVGPEDFEEDDCDLGITDIQKEDYVLVKFPTKKTIKYYIGNIVEVNGNTEFTINFLRKRDNHFTFPVVKDESIIDIEDVVCKLPVPTKTDGTSRSKEMLHFGIDLSNYNVC